MDELPINLNTSAQLLLQINTIALKHSPFMVKREYIRVCHCDEKDRDNKILPFSF